MRSVLSSLAVPLLIMACHAQQPSVHVAFNLANCVAHSRQLGALGALDPSIHKTLVINRLDSAIAPAILDRFGLSGIPGLSLAYLPSRELARLLPTGSSMVFVLNGRDTIDRFPLEDLPGRIDALNARKKGPPAQPSRIQIRRVPLDNGGAALSSDVHVAAGPRSLWLLDRFLGTLYQADLRDTTKATLRRVGAVKDLLLAAAPSAGYGAMSILPEMIGHVDPITDAPTLLLECTDTSGGQYRFHRLMLTLRAGGGTDLAEVDIEPRADLVFPAMALSGFAVQGERIVSQVSKNMDDGQGFPLFGHYERRNDRVTLVDIAPYDHQRGVMHPIDAYNFVNGSFCDRYFAYASVPVVVDLTTWKETDLSPQLDVSLDSALQFVPGHYFTIDLRCDAQGVTLLTQIKRGLQLARFEQRSEGLRLASLDPIEMPGFEPRSGVLIDPQTFLFTSTKNDALLIGRVP